MSCHSKLYVRYINDVFAVFDYVNACSSFVNILNSQHDNIKFTIEKSTNTLQFLDVDIKISEITVNGSGEIQPIPVHSFTLLLYVPSNGNLVHRAKLISSGDSLFFREVDILRAGLHCA